MDTAHFHLIVNHFPIVGYMIGVLLMACAWARRGERGMFAAAVLVLLFSGLTSLPAYFSGEPAEEIVEELDDVPEVLIERHEDAAKVATLISLIVTALTVLISLYAWRRTGPIPAAPMMILLAATIGVCAVMAWAGNLGGQIRHSEIREVASMAK